MVFEFSETKTPIRNLLVNGEPYFVALDIAKVLGYKREREAIKQHCRYAVKHGIPHPQNNQKTLEVSVIPESDVYRLIIKSELPAAEKFERWVMEEVLPSIRKSGQYKVFKPQNNDYLDMRMQVHQLVQFKGHQVRVIFIENTAWTSINDFNRSLNSRTSANQQAKKLGDHAKKIWLYGNTLPAWFTDPTGLELLRLANRTFNHQLKLPL